MAFEWKSKLCPILLIVISLFGQFGPVKATIVNSISISPSLEKYLEPGRSDNLKISVILFAEAEILHRQARMVSQKTITRKERHQEVVELLRSGSGINLKSIKEDIFKIDPTVEFREFWITPALSFEIEASLLQEILKLDNVRAIVENGALDLIEPVESKPVVGKISSGIASHISSLNVPALWSQGITGKNRLVCSFDTGVEGSHPALSSKWRGNSAGEAAAWFAPSSSITTPFDNAGHGTHTMGLMVGSDAVDSFGVAPDAEWISAAVIDQGQTLSKTFADILAAFQWATDPDNDPTTLDDVPDVILNSWGVPTSIIDACDATFDQAIDNVEAAGIITVFAAGNEGSSPQSLRLPANRASTPYNTLAVGAIDGATNQIAAFSSRGPSSCDPTQIKPEVVAPGVGLYSCTNNGSYTYKSGTSMAAPLIAGLAILLRQYNPEATVEEIKAAIMGSARDLGAAGEDNDYGLGLPDAEAALALMPPPPKPEVVLSEIIIGDDGLGELGETFSLYVQFEKITGLAETLEAYLISEVEGVEIINDYSLYIFGRAGGFATNNSPFSIRFDESLINGQTIPLRLHVYQPFDSIPDSLDFEITAGVAFNGEILTHATSQLNLTVTDVAQYGLGFESIYPAGGEGLVYRGSGNMMYEAGIIVGRNSLQLSSSVRDSSGHAYYSDFVPTSAISTIFPDFDGGYKSCVRVVDSQSEIQIPITIDNSVSSYDEIGHENYLIFNYLLKNNSNENLTNLHFGFFSDFDLGESGEMLSISHETGMLIQSGLNGWIGILPFTDSKGIISKDNGSDKTTFTRAEKYGLINNSSVLINDSTVSDFLTVISFGPYDLTPGDSALISFALIVADDSHELANAAELALLRHFATTYINETTDLLPSDFRLHQNYPNPFNPTTHICFELDRTTNVKLSIHNILGQEISLLYDQTAAPGSHSVIWDGKDSDGNAVASGIYFYRMKTDRETFTKKMILLK